jgi:hypothetical protein
MDKALFRVYDRFSQFQGLWLTGADLIDTMSLLFMTESLPRGE